MLDFIIFTVFLVCICFFGAGVVALVIFIGALITGTSESLKSKNLSGKKYLKDKERRNKNSNRINILVVLGFFIIITFAWTSSSFSKILYYDDFEDGKIDEKYEFKFHKGKWIEKDGVITQTQETPGDHTYLVLNGGFEEPHTALVKIRVDKWGDSDLARCGLGFRLDPGDGSGYAFLIHHYLNNMDFLNDHHAWKQNDTEPLFGAVKIGTWYWMKAEIFDDGLAGKIWEAGEPEPKDWLLESPLDFGRIRPKSGQVGLNGGSSTGLPGLTVVSFDNWMICETADECTPDAVLTVQTAGIAGNLPIIWDTIKDQYLDINEDGQVNILDLVIVASSFGEKGTFNNADINGDGVVNIQDLVLVANGIN